jgi:aryl-alcohol dehydrogenase-like predicted oxidoreductase
VTPAPTPPLSPIGLGGNIFGHFTSAAETAHLLDLAFAHGVTFVDTSDSYSEGESERLIGQAIAHRRNAWTIATKAGLRSDEDPAGLARPAHLRAKLEASLRRLDTDHIDIYQLHHHDPVTPAAEAMEVLQDLVTEGKIRSFGVSNFGAAPLRAYLDARGDGARPSISFLQAHLNFLRRDVEAEVVPLCQSHHIGVLAYGVLGRGVLGGRYQPGQPIDPAARAAVSARVRADLQPEVLDLVGALADHARGLGTTLAGLMVAWTLSRPGVSSVIVGTRNPQQLREVIAGADLRLGPTQLAAMEEMVGDWRRFAGVALGSPLA